jgi:excisionase family DNA binding protein
MSNSNKIWCDVWDGAIYRESCLYHLGKVARENKTCPGCICYENMQLEERLERARSPKRARKEEKSGKEIREPIQRPDADPNQFYSSKELAKLFGRSPRTIQTWAEERKIPAEKNGPYWRFPKAEINGFLKKMGVPHSIYEGIDS